MPDLRRQPPAANHRARVIVYGVLVATTAAFVGTGAATVIRADRNPARTAATPFAHKHTRKRPRAAAVTTPAAPQTQPVLRTPHLPGIRTISTTTTVSASTSTKTSNNPTSKPPGRKPAITPPRNTPPHNPPQSIPTQSASHPASQTR